MVATTTGCQSLLTPRLWNSGDLQTFCEPAPKPNLKISRADAKADFLVEYDEVCEGSETIRRRAFFLEANLAAIQERRRPHFINMPANPTTGISIGAADGKTNSDWYVSIGTDPAYFSIHSAGKVLGPYQLPVYDTGSGRAKKIALTPFALVGDAVLVGSVLGLVIATMWPPYHSIKT